MPDATPAIITDETFGKAQQALLEAKNDRPINPNSPFLLTGFIRCAKCGTRINGHTLNKKYRYYQCRGAMPASNRGKICDALQIRADELESAFLKEYERIATDPLVFLSLHLQLNYYSVKPGQRKITAKDKIDALKKKLKSLEKKENDLLDFFRADTISKEPLQRQLKDIKKQKDQLKNDIESLQSENIDDSYLYISFDGNLTKCAKWNILYPEHLYPKEYPISIEERIEFNRNQFYTLDLKAMVDKDYLKVTAYIDPELLTIFGCQKDYSRFYELLSEFEQKHPEITAPDYFDYGTMLPEDTKFGIIINNFKRNRESKLYHQLTNIGITTWR